MYKNLKTKKQLIIPIIVIIISLIVYYNFFYNKNVDIVDENELEVVNKEKENENENSNDKNTKEEKVVIHVAGAIKKEGVYELDINSRVSDAIEMAGGLKEDANIKDINLASKIEDGMKIYIPTNKEVEENNKDIISNNPSENNYISSSNYNNLTNKEINKKININIATEKELETLPGIGTSTALKIINFREENGNFKTIEDIKNVKGIGDSKYENIKDLICVN